MVVHDHPDAGVHDGPRERQPEKERLQDAAGIGFTKRVVLPRYDPGLDWGDERRVIAQREGDVMLFVVRGHWHAACGVRGFGRVYAPAALVLAWKKHPRFGGHYSDQVATGRISRTTLVEAAEKIDAAFGISGLAAQLDPARTAIVPPRAAGADAVSDR